LRRHFVFGFLISSACEQCDVVSATHDHQLFSRIGGENVWLSHKELLSAVHVLPMADLLHANDGVRLEKDDAIVTRTESQTRPTDERTDVTTTGSSVESQLCDDLIPDTHGQLTETAVGRCQEFDPFHFSILIAPNDRISRPSWTPT
jgi:hypothetical protein